MSARPRLTRATLIALSLTLAAASCRGHDGDAKGGEVVVYTSVDQVFSEPVFLACEAKTGLKVRAVFDTEETKSTGVLNRLLAEAKRPQADVFWSGDPVRPFVLIDKDLVAAYASPQAKTIPATFKGTADRWAGLSARARVLLVNTDKVPEGARPSSIRALTDPRWRGQVAIANPLFGTTTIHIAALFTAWGDVEAERFLRALRDNQIRVASSNGEVKRLVAAGEVAFGLLDTDDAFEARAAGAHVAVVYPDQVAREGKPALGTLFMPTSVVLLEGGPHGAAGRRLIDCLLSADTEERLAKSGGHIPLRPGVPVPEGVQRAEQIHAMSVDYGKIAATMTRIQPLLREWVGL